MRDSGRDIDNAAGLGRMHRAFFNCQDAFQNEDPLARLVTKVSGGDDARGIFDCHELDLAALWGGVVEQHLDLTTHSLLKRLLLCIYDRNLHSILLREPARRPALPQSSASFYLVASFLFPRLVVSERLLEVGKPGLVAEILAGSRNVRRGTNRSGVWVGSRHSPPFTRTYLYLYFREYPPRRRGYFAHRIEASCADVV